MNGLIFLLALLGVLEAITAHSACNRPPYKDVLYLSRYPPAESYCQSAFPRTVTVTTVARRAPTAEPQTTEAADPNARGGPGRCTGPCAAWSSASRRGGPFLSTLCSCIEPPTTVTKTTTPAPTIPPCPPSGQLFKLNGACQCTYILECDPTYRAVDPADQIDVSPRASYADCAVLCDNFSDCGAYSYRPALQECYLIKTGVSFGSVFWAEGNSGIRNTTSACGPSNANCRPIFS